jgi:hypothetical protein
MSPIFEPTVQEFRRTTFRLVGPRALVFPTALEANVAVLARTDMVARPLPVADLPHSPDFASGSWTGRLGDAADGTLTWPNKEATDGTPWRYRFSPTGKLMWLEVYLDGYLDATLCITKVTTARDRVDVYATDGFFQCKSAYERDWIVVKAPRDVIECGTQVWVPATADGFPPGALNAQWTTTVFGGATVTIGASGGAVFTVPGSQSAAISSSASVASTAAWSATCTVQNFGGAGLGSNAVSLRITESSGDVYFIQAGSGVVLFQGGGSGFGQTQLATAPSYALSIESDGEWIWGFVNGQLVGCGRRNHATTTSLATQIKMNATSGSAAAMTVTGVLVEYQAPFLMRGSDKGDYVLPGGATTYPVGGVHARYYNDLDLQATSNRLSLIMAPTRGQAYGGSSGTPEYQNQQDAQINGQSNPLPGAATSNWSCRWFGAIWLPLGSGDFGMQIDLPAASGCAVRVWIGKTLFGTQLADGWTFGANPGAYGWTVSASALAGTLPYGVGTASRTGWYPIVVEYAVDATAHGAPILRINNSPATYTDPGGSVIASGAQTTPVPTTSLSPLGCVDNRYQGTSHYDLVQKTAAAFGYQVAVEPQSLESGLFPGVLAPRLREGHDTDVTLEPDDTKRAESMINYTSALDATDFASSIQGNGAGFQSGNTGQLQAKVYDAPTLSASLFDSQGWQDSADASYVSLLQATLNSELGLRLGPWQMVAGDPAGRHRLAYSWPLPSALSQMRWRPGDGVLIRARDINVYDVTPRQMLLITRQIQEDGTVGTQAGFAARPKTPVQAMRKVVASSLRPQRNYQPQMVTLTGTYVTSTVAANSTDTAFSAIALLPGDQVMSATVRIVLNSTPAVVNLFVNGADQTTVLGGPWGGAVPLVIPIKAVAAVSGGGVLYAQVHNGSGAASTFQYQLLVDVKR